MNKAVASTSLEISGRLYRAIAWISFAILLAGTLIVFPYLPEQIPQNFDAEGSFRGLASRWHIWTLPGFALALHWLLTRALKKDVTPNTIAHIDANTPQSVKDKIQQQTQTLIWFNLAVFNSYLAWVQSIYIGAATEWWSRMPSLTLWMVLVLCFGIIYYFSKILKAQKVSA